MELGFFRISGITPELGLDSIFEVRCTDVLPHAGKSNGGTFPPRFEPISAGILATRFPDNKKPRTESLPGFGMVGYRRCYWWLT